MSGPWLSVIVPTYNGARYLNSALQSLVAQTRQDFDVVAIDDGSTDETVQILKSHSTRLPMTVIQCEHGGNWAANTNRAMSRARGRYLSWLHQDDAWDKGRVACLRDLTNRWPDASLALHPSWFTDREGRRVGAWRCPLSGGTRCLRPGQIVPHLLVQCFIAASATVFKAEAAADLGGLDEDLWCLADWDFWLRLAGRGDTIYCPAALTSFRVHAESQSTARIGRIDDIERQYAVLESRHVAEWEERLHNGHCIGHVARFNYRINMAIMQFVGGHTVAWSGVFAHFMRLGPAGWLIFFRDSNIVARVASRIRAGIRVRPGRAAFRLSDAPADFPQETGQRYCRRSAAESEGRSATERDRRVRATTMIAE